MRVVDPRLDRSNGRARARTASALAASPAKRNPVANRAARIRAANPLSPSAVSVAELTEAIQDKFTAKSWRAYRDALFGFVLRRVDDSAAAEDIVQDVLVKAFTQQESLRTPSKLRPWLFQITRNAVADYYRSQTRLEGIPKDLAHENSEEEEESAARELSQCLMPLLETLPPPYRQALKLADVDGLKQREVASRLGLSLSGAKSRVQRARGMLRDALLNCCSIELDRRGRAVGYGPNRGCTA